MNPTCGERPRSPIGEARMMRDARSTRAGAARRGLSLLLLALSIVGCDALIVQPKPKDGQPAPPVVKQSVSAADFFTQFAQYVEDGGFETTQRMVVCCSRAMHKAGVATPATYDAVLSKYSSKNVAIDENLRSQIVKDLLSLAK